MKSYALGDIKMLRQPGITEADRLAWSFPDRNSYHSLHVERVNESLYMWRDSRKALYYIGTLEELTTYLSTMHLRKLDEAFRAQMEASKTLRLLSQEEVDDLLSDL